MDLFGYQKEDIEHNHLPFDGQVNYFGPVFNSISTDIIARLMQITSLQSDVVKMFGKTIVTKRQYGWFADKPYSYKYSGSQRIAAAFPLVVKDIKQLIEEQTQAQFNACLVNLYHNGEEGMSWHADDEPELNPQSPIASVSFGAERRFDFKHKQTGEKVSLQLENGSLLLMDPESQQHWLHQLPKTKKITEPRINLTFRQMNDWCIAY